MTIDRNTAHRELVTNHRTMAYESQTARLSLRKDQGLYNVRLYDKTFSKTTKQAFKTLPGALTSAEMLIGAYL